MDFNVGAPQVAYREILNAPGQTRYTQTDRLDAKPGYAFVVIDFKPLKQGAGLTFEHHAKADAIPPEFAAGVERGIRVAKEKGLLVGFPVIDFRATLVDGAYRAGDSTVEDFEQAAQVAFRKLKGANCVTLVEPIMKLEILAPKNCLNALIQDLARRRADRIENSQDADKIVVSAFTPLSSMFGYVNALKAISSGRASYSMVFDSYLPVPRYREDPPPPGASMRA